MLQFGYLNTARKIAAAFLCCLMLSSVPVEGVVAQQASTGSGLLDYPETSLGGLTSAEAPMSLDNCRKLCVARPGCVGFDHHNSTNQCRLFAAVGNARPNPASSAGTRSPVAGYLPPAPPLGQEGLQTSTSDVEREVDRRSAVETTAIEAPEPAPYDPMRTVTAFYSALAAADGERASAHVVPAKRGRGPFNVESIQSFFGAMSQPLTLTGTALRSRDEVRASYEYVTDQGRRCRGRADVTTVYTFGKTLISEIRALDGC